LPQDNPPWVRGSYDTIFRFSTRSATNHPVALVLMDNAAYKEFKLNRPQWPRAKHTELLRKLKADGCAMVVFDIGFWREGDPAEDRELAQAMKDHGKVVLMSQLATDSPQHPRMEGVSVDTPAPLFLEAARRWGIGHASPERGTVARQHWPFPAPDTTFQSLPWVAAEVAGAELPREPVKQWLRWYGEDQNTPYEKFSYHVALQAGPRYFANKVVFVGNEPEKPDQPDAPERDKFHSPYTATAWNPRAIGGVEILATTFLNLMNADWLRRPSGWLEVPVLLVLGVALGTLLPWRRAFWTWISAAVLFLLVSWAGIALSHYTNYWFPWLIVAGGQLPCALVVAGANRRAAGLLHPPLATAQPEPPSSPAPAPAPASTVAVPVGGPEAPTIPAPTEWPDAQDYQFVAAPFGEGAFGKVWLVRNAVGEWQALKAVYRKKFESDRPYEVEWNGVSQYKPISGEHLGLLRVEYVSSRKPAGHFYYVMELGDARSPGWEENPSLYQPRDLAWARAQTEKKRLPFRECLQLGLDLTDALDFLHRRQLTHRDIKPSNIIFVRGRPKLADVGLVTRARPPEDVTTYAGTPSYMPPPPEPTGTVQADIYALGMVLFVISTGNDPVYFPMLQTTLVSNQPTPSFMRLNAVILQACQADVTKRYHSAAEMRQGLLTVQDALERESPP
jgi:CHASE2 domain-containing sensor protein